MVLVLLGARFVGRFVCLERVFGRGIYAWYIGYIPCSVGLVWMFVCLEHTHLNEFAFDEDCTMADCTMAIVHNIV